jgi:hypothetical protein
MIAVFVVAEYRIRNLAKARQELEYAVQTYNNGSQLCERLGRAALNDTNVAVVAIYLRQLTPWAATPPWADPPQSPDSIARLAYDMMDRVRSLNQQAVIAHLRALTGEDLGDDAKLWIEKYAESAKQP